MSSWRWGRSLPCLCPVRACPAGEPLPGGRCLSQPSPLCAAPERFAPRLGGRQASSTSERQRSEMLPAGRLCSSRRWGLQPAAAAPIPECDPQELRWERHRPRTCARSWEPSAAGTGAEPGGGVLNASALSQLCPKHIGDPQQRPPCPGQRQLPRAQAARAGLGWAGRDLPGAVRLSSPPAKTRLPRATSSPALNASRLGASTAALGNLSQCLTTLRGGISS